MALYADPEVTQFVHPFDRKGAKERLRQAECEWSERHFGMLAILDRTDGRFLGRTGLKYWPQFDEAELQWTLRRDTWGRGYATEAGSACIEWAFSKFDLPYLTAMINVSNDQSVRVAERLGLVPLRNDLLLGEPVVVYEIQRPA